MSRNTITKTRMTVMGDRSSLKFDGGSSVGVPYAFPTDAFSVSFWYNSLGDKALQDNDQIFGQAGSFSFGRQALNSAYVYAYLNAPNDYAGLRHLRFVATRELKPLGWHHRVISVYVENDTAYMKEYEDGILIRTSTVNYTGSSATPSGDLYIGNSQISSTSYGFHGLMKDVKIYNKKLTAEEVAKLYYARNVEHKADGEWLFEEGAGSIAYDTSGNGNDGIITGATWSADVPSPARKIVGENMIYNGDFSYQPPFIDETSANNRWIDGTADGSTASLKNIIGWYQSGGVSTYYGALTTKDGYKSLHIHIDPGAYNQVFGNATTYFAERKDNAMALLPNTEYKFSGWVKSENTSGDSGGASLKLNISDASGSYTEYAYLLHSGQKIDQDWTYYENTFTTGASSVNANVGCMVYGHTGAGTLEGDWYFRDLQLRPTN